MSTKIYKAYRIPSAALVKTLASVRKKVMDRVMPVVVEDLVSVGATSYNGIRNRIMTQVRESEDDGQGLPYPLDPYDIRCGFGVYQHEQDPYLYLVPYGRVMESSDLDGCGAVDFSYWDNTDPDENVSDEEWKKRDQVWKNILDLDSLGASFDILSSSKMTEFDGNSSFLTASYYLLKAAKRQQDKSEAEE